MDDRERSDKVAARLHVVEALIWAHEHAEELLRVCRAAPDRLGARRHLEEGHDLSEFQAEHILDRTFGQLTTLGEARLREERDRLLRGEPTWTE